MSPTMSFSANLYTTTSFFFYWHLPFLHVGCQRPWAQPESIRDKRLRFGVYFISVPFRLTDDLDIVESVEKESNKAKAKMFFIPPNDGYEHEIQLAAIAYARISFFFIWCY